jgi:formate--tetrahydrofolate ligase
MCLIHGGPFANIAHGCNSLFATKTAMNIADYTVTEAGFGSDLGAEKFFNIVCNNGSIKLNAVVLVASIRSLKMHGGNKTSNLNSMDDSALLKGIDNLKQHILNIQGFNLPLVVAVNSFTTDSKKDIEILKSFLESNKIIYSFTTVFSNGSIGGKELAQKVIQICTATKTLKPTYKMDDLLSVKIFNIVSQCYGAAKVVYSSKAKAKLKRLEHYKG